jgi:hypothetical protein
MLLHPMQRFIERLSLWAHGMDDFVDISKYIIMRPICLFCLFMNCVQSLILIIGASNFIFVMAI